MTMASFTCTVRDAVGYLGATYHYEGGLLVVDGDIGLSNYPIFNESHRKALNSNILRQYWLSEIGVETPELWKFNIESDMMLNMPYFNQVYESTLLGFDPRLTVDIITNSDGVTESIGAQNVLTKTSTGSNAGSRDVQSQFPQMMLKGSGDYASAGADSTSNSESTVDSDVDTDGTENSTREDNSQTKGYQGRPGDLLQSWRDAIINVDMSVVASLEDNFMHILNNGDSYSDRFTNERYLP